MRNIEDIMTIIKTESFHTKVNKLTEIKVMRAAKSAELFNDVTNGKNDPLYRLLPQIDSYNSNN